MNEENSFDIIDYIVAGVSIMVSWLDQHQGSAIVILTFALVCITWWYARRTSQMVRIIEQQTHINIEPLVTIQPEHLIEVVDGKFNLKIHNEGTVGIQNVLIGVWTRGDIPVDLQRELFEATKRPGDLYRPSKMTAEIPKLAPKDLRDIELDITSIRKGIERLKESDRPNARLTLIIKYYREADYKPYRIEKQYSIEHDFLVQLISPLP